MRALGAVRSGRGEGGSEATVPDACERSALNAETTAETSREAEARADRLGAKNERKQERELARIEREYEAANAAVAPLIDEYRAAPSRELLSEIEASRPS